MLVAPQNGEKPLLLRQQLRPLCAELQALDAAEMSLTDSCDATEPNEPEWTKIRYGLISVTMCFTDTIQIGSE